MTDKKKYQADFSLLTENLFSFSNKDIYDLKDLYKLLTEIEDVSILQVVVRGLRANLIGDSILDGIREKSVQTDIIHVNLLPISIPKVLYIARLTLDKKSIRDLNTEKRRLRHDMDYVKALLAYNTHSFPWDFICHDGLLISFDPLEEQNLGKIGIIDEGTIEKMGSKEYF